MKQWRFSLFPLLFLMLVACRGQDAVPTEAVPPTATSQPTAVSLPTWSTPTAALPTPTPFTDQSAIPTRPHDAALADWTLLVYMVADNGRDPIALQQINQMEAAGTAAQVQVIIQLDRAASPTNADTTWSDTRRYRLVGDADPTTISAEPLLTLGEQNMGDPAVLADFIQWGMQQYPANQYALLLWGDGAGWAGGWHDADTGTDLPADDLSLADLSGALATALADSSLPQLDIIAFDASLMAQLDVLQALRPYAKVAIASQSLAPIAGWPYEANLRSLYAQPQQTAAQLSQQWVTDFVGQYSTLQPNGRASLAAIDLNQLPQVTTAVEQLAAILAQNTAVHSTAVGLARAQAQTFALGLDAFGAVDLHHFATLLSQMSTDPAVIAAATELATAVEASVWQTGHGRDIQHGAGINLYFPRLPHFYDEAYTQLSQLPNWHYFLADYYQTGLADAPLPAMTLLNRTNATVGVQDPVWVELQLLSQQPTTMQLWAGLRQADGRRLLLTQHPLPQTAVDGTASATWRAGVHALSFQWHTDTNYLYDAQNNGDYVLMQPVAVGSTLTAVAGEWRRADGSQAAEATLLFETETQQLVGVWQLSADGRLAAPLLPQSGDAFQVYQLFDDGDGTAWARELGPTLYFDGQGLLYWRTAPLPDGAAFLAVVGENLAGQTAVELLQLTVANQDQHEAASLYIDPKYGFKFLYPQAWPAPLPLTGWQWSTHLTQTQLLISRYPDVGEWTLAQFKQQVLAQFGAVDRLYESERLVAGQRSLLTAYGYTDEAGLARSGLFLLFIDPHRTGFVVDIDGPQSDEAVLLATLGLIADTWEFSDTAVGLPQWQEAEAPLFDMAYPPDFTQQAVADWYKFSRDAQTFMAWQVVPEPADPWLFMAEWVHAVGQGMQTFNPRQPYQFSLYGQAWARTDFSYDVADGVTIWGFVMVRAVEGQLLMGWAEAPGATYNELAPGAFLTMAADLRLKR